MEPCATAPIIYVVDDDAPFLRSVVRFLKAAGHSAEGFESAGAFLKQLSPEARGCVIVDLRMPELGGLDLQAKLAASDNPLPIIFLTGEGDIPTSVTAIKQGAEDFLTKTAPKAKLMAAVERALARNESERKKLTRRLELKQLFARLTEREVEILQHVIQGKLNKQIADECGINERTVKLHRTSITRKLGVPSVAGLTSLCNELGDFTRLQASRPEP
jgi:two-component system response regulator FixJ